MTVERKDFIPGRLARLSQKTSPSRTVIALPRPFLQKKGMQPTPPALPAAAGGGRALSIVGWTLVGVTLALSLTSFLGFAIWLLPIPVAAALLTIGIIVAKRRGKAHGISLIIAAVLIIPLSFLAQLMSLAVYGTSAMKEQEWQETQMLENLRRIDRAKGAWVAKTEAAKAAPVTMPDLTSYLGGGEIIPVVGERYDPRPVGRDPTATLPNGKHLWDYPTGGAAYTSPAWNRFSRSVHTTPSTWPADNFSILRIGGSRLFWKTSPLPGRRRPRRRARPKNEENDEGSNCRMLTKTLLRRARSRTRA